MRDIIIRRHDGFEGGDEILAVRAAKSSEKRFDYEGASNLQTVVYDDGSEFGVRITRASVVVRRDK